MASERLCGGCWASETFCGASERFCVGSVVGAIWGVIYKVIFGGGLPPAAPQNHGWGRPSAAPTHDLGFQNHLIYDPQMAPTTGPTQNRSEAPQNLSEAQQTPQNLSEAIPPF